VAAANRAIEKSGSRLIVLDDAFQHRRIHRDLDVLMIDALEPFGFGRVFPRGTLREPLSGLARAHVVALSRSDVLDEAGRQAIRRQVQQYAPEAVWVEVTHRPEMLLSSSGERQIVGALAGSQIAAFCGIGNPAGFRHTLESCGFQLADFRTFPDHHAYTNADVDSLAAWADGLEDLAAVLCTHKDLVKLRTNRIGKHPLWALKIGLEILAGREGFEAALDAVLLSNLRQSSGE
jgi:tetraacyldisaccharide 4'-kinase